MNKSLTIGKVELTLHESGTFYEGKYNDFVIKINLKDNKWSGTLTREGLIIFTPAVDSDIYAAELMNKQIRLLRIELASLFGSLNEFKAVKINKES